MIEMAAAIVLMFQPLSPKTEPEFFIKAEVQGPLVLSTRIDQSNIAYIRYGEGYARQEVMLKWPLDDKKLTDRVKELKGKWVLAKGRMEIGLPPEVRLESIRETAASRKE